MEITNGFQTMKMMNISFYLYGGGNVDNVMLKSNKNKRRQQRKITFINKMKLAWLNYSSNV